MINIKIFIVLGILIILIIINTIKSNKEHFLYPIKDLYCEHQGFEKAYSPQLCDHNGKYNYYSLCRCRTKNQGNCTKCFENVNVRRHNKKIYSMLRL